MACGAVQIGVKKRTRPPRRLQKTMSRTAVPRQRPKTPPPVPTQGTAPYTDAPVALLPTVSGAKKKTATDYLL